MCVCVLCMCVCKKPFCHVMPQNEKCHALVEFCFMAKLFSSCSFIYRKCCLDYVNVYSVFCLV